MQRCVSVSLSLLVDVLSFSDQNSEHVQVACFSRLPNNSEAKLSLWVLAYVECSLVLTVLSITKFWIAVY